MWSGDHGRKMKDWPDLHQWNHCVLRYHKFKCAHGTTNVQCPWHYESSVPLALLEFSAPGNITKFTAQYSSSAWVDPGTTSLDRLPVHLGMKLELPFLLWGSSLSPHSPQGMEWILARQVTVSPYGNWAEFSSTIGVCDGVTHSLMLASL